MSVYTAKTGLSSILKPYSPLEREKAKTAAFNKVRFELPSRQMDILEAIKAANEQNYQPMNELLDFFRQTDLDDIEFHRILSKACDLIHELFPFVSFIETLLAMRWRNRSMESIKIYMDFCIDVMLTDSKYIHCILAYLIDQWLPTENDAEHWSGGKPDETTQNELQNVHNLIKLILSVIPLTSNELMATIEKKFPYYKRAPHILSGYIHNVLWLIEYQPQFTKFVMHLIIENMLILDVNAPRNEIIDADSDSDDESDDGDDNNKNSKQNENDVHDCEKTDTNKEDISHINAGTNESYESPMNHPIAHTLDICMEKLYEFLDTKNPNDPRNATEADKFFKILLKEFDDLILPSYDTHHVQFLIFYYCSFKQSLTKTFLIFLWDKITNPNYSGVIRQTAVGYLSSFLARCKFVNLNTIKFYLQEMCNWTHQYIQDYAQYRSYCSLKVNVVFFSVCQAIFYIIAFRSRDLTSDQKNLQFLQSLHLSGLVTCTFNPLRVCIQSVATAFADVTRSYQLAYCHTILERNKRCKLATVYGNDTSTPEELLDTLFPFDPYLLKISGRRITEHYLQYQPSEAEKSKTISVTSSLHTMNDNEMQGQRRKRLDSEITDDIDDFVIAETKRRKRIEQEKIEEREAQCMYD